jgi:hypothetical protein
MQERGYDSSHWRFLLPACTSMQDDARRNFALLPCFLLDSPRLLRAFSNCCGELSNRNRRSPPGRCANLSARAEMTRECKHSYDCAAAVLPRLSGHFGQCINPCMHGQVQSSWHCHAISLLKNLPERQRPTVKKAHPSQLYNRCQHLRPARLTTENNRLKISLDRIQTPSYRYCAYTAADSLLDRSCRPTSYPLSASCDRAPWPTR